MQIPSPSSRPSAQKPVVSVDSDVGAEPFVDKSRFKFQKLLHPFTLERGIATPIIWFLLDWLVLGVAIASLLVVESWWVKVFASLVAALWIARLFVITRAASPSAP